MYKTRKSVFDHVSKHREESWKYSLLLSGHISFTCVWIFITMQHFQRPLATFNRPVYSAINLTWPSIWGAFQSTKISGFHFRKFQVTNETPYFKKRGQPCEVYRNSRKFLAKSYYLPEISGIFGWVVCVSEIQLFLEKVRIMYPCSKFSEFLVECSAHGGFVVYSGLTCLLSKVLIDWLTRDMFSFEPMGRRQGT